LLAAITLPTAIAVTFSIIVIATIWSIVAVISIAAIVPRASAIAFPIKPILPPTYIYATHVVDHGRSGGVSPIHGRYSRCCIRGRGEACQQQARCRAEHQSPESHVSPPLPKSPAIKITADR